jgi:RNA polymerase sigma-70 factor (ECF subfamily)
MGLNLDYSKFDDETLLRLIAQQQADALSQLYDRYGRLAYSIALNASGDAAQAEEITQDAFLKVWQHAATYRVDEGKVAVWLGRIVRNRAIDLFRRQRVRAEGNSVSWAVVEETALPDGYNVEQDVAVRQQRANIRAAMAQLPAEQRDALALAYFQGYTQEEIAAHTGQPLGTIKTRIRLAMQKLRSLLEA